jgi:hypothetical protein
VNDGSFATCSLETLDLSVVSSSPDSGGGFLSYHHHTEEEEHHAPSSSSPIVVAFFSSSARMPWRGGEVRKVSSSPLRRMEAAGF